MKTAKRTKGIVCCILAMAMLLTTMVSYAESIPAIVQTVTDETSVRVYARGIPDEATDIKFQVGSKGALDMEPTSVLDEELPISTLVLIDNSISIPEASREKIMEFLNAFISDRADRERIQLATFGEEMEPLTEYESDYTVLKTALDGIEYVDRETYLTDVLYEVLERFNSDNLPTFRRILIVSDGVDEKSLGITREELTSLLKEHPYLIYSVGSRRNNNDDMLENMFALSRISNAQSFVIEDEENVLSIVGALSEDRQVKVMVHSFDGIDLDGSQQNCALTFLVGDTPVSLETIVKLPFPSESTATEEVVEPAPEEEPVEEVVEEVAEPEAPTDSLMDQVMAYLPFIIGGVAAILAILLIVLLVLKRKKKKEKESEFSYREEASLTEIGSQTQMDDVTTELIGGGSTSQGDSTVLLLTQPSVKTIRLEDIHDPSKVFMGKLDPKLTIGRVVREHGIAIAYDKSVSSKHCEIELVGNCCYLRDLGSTNGTSLNGQKLFDKQVEIESGAILKVGRVEFRVEIQ